MEHFFLTLPSNSSTDIYPNNTLTHYFTKLAAPIQLEGTWECGLSEIFFPYSWPNVIERNNILHYSTDGKHWRKLAVPAGYYNSGQEVVDALNEELNVFSFHKKTERVTVNLDQGASLRMTGDLGQMLGFKAGELLTGPATGHRLFDRCAGLHALYLYTDIIDSHLVGDANVPLLRILRLKGKHGEMIAWSYDKPHYFRVNRRHFQTVEVDIRDGSGNPVPFESGKVIVTLHFRKKRHHASSLLL